MLFGVRFAKQSMNGRLDVVYILAGLHGSGTLALGATSYVRPASYQPFRIGLEFFSATGSKYRLEIAALLNSLNVNGRSAFDN
jgi:hypothetical protein